MAILTFEQLKKLPQYKIAHKMYYNKYPICVRFVSTMTTYSYGTEAWLDDLKQSKEVRAWLKKYCEFDYRTRHDYHLAVYLKDVEGLSKIYQRYKKIIVAIEAPANESHHEKMIDDLNITVRDKLFYNEYRYKIKSYLYRADMDRWEELIDVVESSMDEDSYRMNPMLREYKQNKQLDEEMQLNSTQSILRMHRWLPYSGTATVYLKDYDDVCTLHMMFKSIITSTTKIILTSEL
jgi:hypothetical protein